MKKGLLAFIAAMMIVSLFGINKCASAAGLNDISSHWAKDEIQYLVNQGVTTGYPDGTFKPNNNITRAEFVTLLTRVFDYSTANSSFNDVKSGDWYYAAVSKAVNEGITTGYPDNTFKPTKNITRQEIAVMVVRALNKQGSYDEKAALTFADNNEIANYAKSSLETMLAYGIMNGRTKDTIAPTANATRAETSVMLYRMIQLVEKDTEPVTEEPTPNEPTTEPTEPVTEPTTDPTPVTEKHYTEMTLAELKQVYGSYEVVVRVDGSAPGVGVITDDWMNRYYEKLHGPFGESVPDPDTYMAAKEVELSEAYASNYTIWYPKWELISYKGISYKDSPLYTDRISSFVQLSSGDMSILPENPKVSGGVMVDLHTYSDQFGVYLQNDTLLGSFDDVMYQADGVWMADVKSLYSYFGNVVDNGASVTIKYGTNTVELTQGTEIIKVNGVSKTLSTKVEVQGTTVFAPLREVSSHLGLYTRAFEKGAGRIEVANFPLEVDWK